jgi:dTDP-4-dehydrorhamnose reductase
MKPKLLVLGGTGMLGQAVVNLLKDSDEFEVYFTSRKQAQGIYADQLVPDTLDKILEHNPDWIINCVGVIKPYIDDSDLKSRSNAHEVNTVFPFKLSKTAEKIDAKIIQIATDCVFSGSKGNYSELDTHDPVDFYGLSKSKGEIVSENFMNLRCSIVGRDPRNNNSLLEWFLSQDPDSKVTGYLDHIWNGITTNAFARICRGIIQEDLFKSGTFHQVPADEVSKGDLLEIFQSKFNRRDLIIEKKMTGETVNRTISTIDADGNLNRWLAAGYQDVPTIKELIEEL